MTYQAKSIELADLSKRFGTVDALFPTSLKVDPGEFLTLLGPSGCGKSTILRLIAGLEAPTGGRVEIGGVDATALPPSARDVGIMFQDYALFPHMSIADNIAYGLKMQGLGRGERRAHAAHWLERIGLADAADRRPHQLSGGQRQRVALARALITEPGALLLDEPLSALDANLRAQLRDELRRLHRDVGTTFLCVTHDQEEAMVLSDRIAILRAGRVEQIGPPVDLYDRPASRFVAAFMGRCAFWPAKVVAPDGGRCELDGLGIGVDTVSEVAVAPGQSVDVVVRLEALRLTGAEAPDSIASAIVEDLAVLGPRYAAEVRLASGLSARVEAARGTGLAVELGASVGLALAGGPLPIVPMEKDE